MAAPLARYLRRLAAMAAMDGRARAIGGHQQLLVDSARVLLLLGSITLTHQLPRSAPSSGNVELHLVLGLVIWLLGAALVTLSLVARQFPRLAAAGVCIARALRNYLLGGL